MRAQVRKQFAAHAVNMLDLTGSTLLAVLCCQTCHRTATSAGTPCDQSARITPPPALQPVVKLLPNNGTIFVPYGRPTSVPAPALLPLQMAHAAQSRGSRLRAAAVPLPRPAAPM